MGWHDRITAQQFTKIKKDCTVPKEDHLVAAKHGVSCTTAKHIRLSRDYQAYCERTAGKYWRSYAVRDVYDKNNPQRIEKDFNVLDLSGATVKVVVEGGQ